jgi:uncharacterized protein
VTGAYDWLAEANRYFGKNVASKDVTRYEIHKVMGVKPDEYTDFYGLRGEKVHWESEIRPGVQEVIERLSGQSNIHFVTARQKTMRDVSSEWLRKYNIPYNTITLLGHSHKVPSAKTLKCDWFIEDSLSNAQELSQAGFNVLLVDCNYNKGILNPNIKRVGDWHQIEEIIQNAKYQSRLSI